MNETKTELKRWLTPTDLHKEFDFGLSTQARLRKENKIPYSKIGNFIKYDRIEINKWLENNKVSMRA